MSPYQPEHYRFPRRDPWPDMAYRTPVEEDLITLKRLLFGLAVAAFLTGVVFIVMHLEKV